MEILISNEAYKEFKEFLYENNINSHNIRINLAAIVCSGPIFNITEYKGDIKDNDVSEKVGEITFITSRSIVDEYEGFIILSNKENGYDGLSFRPFAIKEGGCDSCMQKCHI